MRWSGYLLAQSQSFNEERRLLVKIPALGRSPLSQVDELLLISTTYPTDLLAPFP